MAPYNYEPVSIIYGFSLPQFPEAFTQTHIYFMALHDIPKNVSTETPIYCHIGIYFNSYKYMFYPVLFLQNCDLSNLALHDYLSTS